MLSAMPRRSNPKSLNSTIVVRLPKFGEHRMIGDPLEHWAVVILQDRGRSFVFPPPGFIHHFPVRL